MLFKRKKRSANFLTCFNSDNILCPIGYKPLSHNPEILRCVEKTAQAASSMTLMLMKNSQNGDERIKNKLSYKLDINPCSNMTRKNFYYTIFKQMQISGNAVVYPSISSEGYFEDFTILDNTKVTFEDLENSYIIRYNGVKLNSDTVLNFVYNPTSDRPYKGQGVLPNIIDAIENLNQENSTRDGFLKSKWKPSLIMSVPSDIEELSDVESRNKILKSYTETTKEGDPWIIPAGEMDIKTITPLTLNDLAIKENLEIDKKTLACGLGVPAFLIGMGEFNLNEYNNFISTTVMSIAQNVQQELTRKILLDISLYFKFNPKSLLQYSLNEKIELVTKLISLGLLSRNEGRNEFDYAPVKDNSMNEYMVLENYIPVKETGNQNKLKKDT